MGVNGVSDAGSVIPADNAGDSEPALPTRIPNEAAECQETNVDGNFSNCISEDAPTGAGSLWEQTYAGGQAAFLTDCAALSTATGGRLPTDSRVDDILTGLPEQAPIEGEKTATADYASTVKGKSADEVYDRFTEHIGDAFKAAGVNVRGGSGKLHDGERLMLEQPREGARPPVWAPIEVHLKPETHEIDITTLAGHPIRGNNHFQITDDGHGNAIIAQHSKFQGANGPMTALGVKMGALDEQHAIWQKFHAYLRGE